MDAEVKPVAKKSPPEEVMYVTYLGPGESIRDGTQLFPFNVPTKATSRQVERFQTQYPFSISVSRGE